MSKSKYLSVVLSLRDRLPHNPRIHSSQPASYYSLVLKDTEVIPGQGDKTYRRMLATGGEELLALGPPDGDAALPLEDGPADDDSASFDAPNSTPTPGSKRARPEAKPKRGKKARPAPSSSSSSSSAPDSPAPRAESEPDDASFDAGGGDVRSKVTAWVEMPRGPRFKLDSYKPKGLARYKRLQVECTYHDSCIKRRSVSMKHTRVYGDLEIIAYLRAWNRLGADLDKEAHMDRRLRVPWEEVERYALSLGDTAAPILALM